MPTAAEAAAAPTNVEQLVLKVAQASEVTPTLGSITYSAPAFVEQQLNDGSMTSSIVLTLTGDTFKGNVGAALGKLTNVPTGLTGHPGQDHRHHCHPDTEWQGHGQCQYQ